MYGVGTAYLFLLPAIACLLLIAFVPTAQAIYFSFTNFDLIGTAQWIGWRNYAELLRDQTFRQVLSNTLIYLGCAVPLLVTIPLGLAILVNQKLRGVAFFRMVYYLPVIVSVVVSSIAWKWVYAEHGVLNGLAQWFSGQNMPWLTDPRLAIYAVVAVIVWRGLGYYMVIYLAGLQAIPQDLYEAGAIDGCDGWRKHWDITIPLMRPYIVLVAVISGIAAMKIFEEVYIMTKGDPANSTKTAVYYLYEQGFTNLQMGYASAIGVILFLAIMLISLITVRFITPASS
jgi:putative chitobiose transport system permease protein